MIYYTYNQIFCELFVTPENINIHIRSIKELHDLLSVTRNGFPCQIHESPVSLYNVMFTPLGLFVKSQCELKPDQN